MEIDETIKEGLLRLERYAQNIPGGFHCCAEDPENGYPFAYISDRFLEILGWERAEFAAKFNNRYTALLHPDDLADGLRYRNAENSATYAQEGDSIFRMLGKNGYRWVSSAANRVESRISPPIWSCGKSWNSRTAPSGKHWKPPTATCCG